MKAIGKITAKVILGALLTKQPDNSRTEVIRIQGRVDKAVVKPSSLNPENVDVKLIGEFIATNMATGEQFQSATLYPMGSGMIDMMSTAEPGSMFAVRVFLTDSKKTVQGYAFDFESALEVKASDTVTRLGDAFLALPKPNQEDEDAMPPTSGSGKAAPKKSK